MTEQEILKIQRFLDDPEMVTIIKKVLLSLGLDNLSLGKDNAGLGEEARAKIEAKLLLDKNFAELEKYKKTKEKTIKDINPAR